MTTRRKVLGGIVAMGATSGCMGVLQKNAEDWFEVDEAKFVWKNVGHVDEKMVQVTIKNKSKKERTAYIECTLIDSHGDEIQTIGAIEPDIREGTYRTLVFRCIGTYAGQLPPCHRDDVELSDFEINFLTYKECEDKGYMFC